MNLLVMKRYDRHNKTLLKTDFFNSVFCLVTCSSKIKFIFHMENNTNNEQSCEVYSNLTRLLLRKSKIKQNKQKTKQQQKKVKETQLGQVFQSVTSFFFFLIFI